LPGNINEACGTGGAMCKTCIRNQVCVAGTCQ
jgi:hypothetical protein